jgi:hypothetical protein
VRASRRKPRQLVHDIVVSEGLIRTDLAFDQALDVYAPPSGELL